MRRRNIPKAVPSSSAPLALLGADFDIYPHLSGYGLLLRVCRLMALEPRELVSSLGLRLRKDINLLVQVQRPGRAQMALCTAAGVDPAYARTHWLPESWSPIQTSGTLDRPAPVRQCPECAQHGYHTAAFQLPSIVECPWHGQRLIESCPRCRRPPVSAARRSRANGGLSLRLRSVRCRCGIGIDAAISIAARRGLASSYWLWARDQRTTRYLVAPDRDSRWREHYRHQAALPDALLLDATALEIEEFNAAGLAELDRRQCWAWCLLGSERPMTYVPLPARVLAMLSEVSEEVVRGLPADVQTPLELVTFHAWMPRWPCATMSTPVLIISSRPTALLMAMRYG